MKSYLLFLFLFLSFNPVFSQITFQKVYGSMYTDAGFSVVQSEDSGFIFSGSWNDNMFLARTDKYGDLIWNKFLTGADGLSMIRTSDGGFAMVGLKVHDFYFAKANSNGDSVWAKLFHGGAGTFDIGRSVKQTYDGGYILAGNIWMNPVLIKTDVNGDSLWGKAYEFNASGQGYSVVQTPDSGYALLAFVRQGNVYSPNDIYLCRTDSIGDTLWVKHFAGSSDDHAYCIENTPDGGFIIGASTMSYGAGSYDMWLIKTDSNGNTLWTRTFGGLDNEWCNWVCKTNDGGYILAGSSQSFSNGGYDAYIIKTDSLGIEQWHKMYGGFTDDYAYGITQTFDGGYVFVGIRNDNVYLVKIDGNGSTVGIFDLGVQSAYSIAPNPIYDEAIISLDRNLSNASLTIFDNFGQVVHSQENISGNEVTFRRNNLTPGLYIVKVIEKSKVVVSDKIVIIE